MGRWRWSMGGWCLHQYLILINWNGFSKTIDYIPSLKLTLRESLTQETKFNKLETH